MKKTIDVMRKQRAVYNVAEGRAAADEDRVKLNFKGTKNGEAFNGGTAEGYVFVLGQGRMLPEFEEAVRGMKAGEKKTFPLTFPGRLRHPGSERRRSRIRSRSPRSRRTLLSRHR